MKRYFAPTYIILLVVQIIICNYLHVTPYLYLTILPVMVLCLPLKVSTLAALFIAFGSGLAIDFIADGLPGLNTLALLPVALLRRPIIRGIFGEELISRGEDISAEKYGMTKTFIAFSIVQVIFMLLYVWVDNAGSRPLWFCAARFGVSTLAGILLSIVLTRLLTEGVHDRWS